MLTEVMRFYSLTRPPIDAGFFETEHHTQVSPDIRGLVAQFDATPSKIRQLLRGDFDPGRSRELVDEMRAAGPPT